MEQSINDTISTTSVTLVNNYENLIPQSKSLMDIDLFFSNVSKGCDDFFNSVNDLFGSSASIHSDIGRLPFTHIDAHIFSYTNIIQYCVVLILFMYVALIYFKFSDRITRLFELTFSFSILNRQLQTINHSIYTSAIFSALSLIVLVPLILYSNFKDATILVQYSFLNVPLYLELIIFCGVIFLYTKIVKVFFESGSRYRYFFKRLNISEVVFLSTYSIILTPFVLLAFIENPYQHTLIVIQNLVVILLWLHYLITNFRLFIEEKVSYIQSFLYFCTVKVVVISFAAYLGFLLIKLYEL